MSKADSNSILKSVALAVILCTMAVAALVARAPSTSATLLAQECTIKYRSLTVTASDGSSSNGSNSWTYPCNDKAAKAAAQKKCYAWVKNDLSASPFASRMARSRCGLPPTDDEDEEEESEAPSGGTPAGTDASGTSSSDDERSRERERAYEEQKRGGAAIPGARRDGNEAEKVVQRPGESDEDFRARERAVAYEAQKRREQKKPQDDKPKPYYVSKECRGDGSSIWTFSCCKPYETRAECEKEDARRACVLYDPTEDMKKAEEHSRRGGMVPACIH
jgi:hypothetical protein